MGSRALTTPLPPPKIGGDLASTRLGKGSPPASGGGKGVVIVPQPFPGAREWAESKRQTIKRDRTLAMRDPSVETRLLETARRLHEGYPDSPFATICNLQFPMLFVPLSPLPIGAGFRRKLSVVRSQFSATLPALAVTAARRRSFGLFIPYSLFPVPCSLFPIPYSVLPFLPICNLKSAMLSVRLSSPRTPPRR